MAIQTYMDRFSKPGKGFPQVALLDKDGNPIVEPKTGKPVIGNEQYQCLQLSDDSIAFDSAESFMTDVLESVNGDLEKAAEMFRTGWNRVTRLDAAGLNEYQKAAKNVIKLNLPWAKGLSVDEVADKLRSMNG